jgi:hypothetical protein
LIFDPIVRHELAHVARHDVLIAWSARAVSYTALALLAIPAIWAFVDRDLSLLPIYGWRALLLLAVAFVAAAGILRSREHDADLSSARTPAQRETLAEVLGLSVRPAATGWRRILSLHPSSAERTMTLEDPARLAAMSSVDAGLAAFLAMLTVPLLVSVFATVPSITAWAYVAPAVLVGPLLGATVGLSVWRLALVARVVGARLVVVAATCRVAGAVLFGALLGGTASLANVGSPAPIATPGVLVGAAALGGATLVGAGLAILATDTAWRFSARAFTATALVLSGTLFALTVWAASTVSNAWDLGGWALTGPVILSTLTHPVAAVVVIAQAAAVLVLMLLGTLPRAPEWALDGEASDVWDGPHWAPRLSTTSLVGLVAGGVAALTILTFRIAQGPPSSPDEQAQRFYTYLWIFAGAGAVAGAVLLTLYGLRAAAGSLLAAPLASVVATIGFLAINQAYGGDLSWAFVEDVVRPGLAVGVLLLFFVSWLAVIPRRRSEHRRSIASLVVLTVAVGTTVSVGALASRATLGLQIEAPRNSMSADQYVTLYTPAVVAKLDEVERTVQQVDKDAEALATRAKRVRIEVLGPLRALHTEASQLNVEGTSLRQTHDLLIGALASLERAFEDFARGFESGDGTALVRAHAERRDARAQLEAWFAAVARHAGVQ